jgi:hypothetical protein
MKHLARFFVVVVFVAMSTVVAVRSAAPVYATDCWYSHCVQLWCGPSSNVYLSVVSNSPGHVGWGVAYAGSDGTTVFTGGSFTAGGSWYHVFPSRYMNSYYLTTNGGAHIVASSAGCT